MGAIATIQKERQVVESRPSGEFQVHHIVELDDLDRLAGAWDRLASKSGSPIGQFIWARACAEALSDRYSLHVVAVGPRERPIAIAPLARRRRPLAPMELLGAHELREPMDFLYEDALAADALVRVVASLPRPLSLKRFPASSLALSAVEDAYRKRGLVLNREAGACPYIRLGERHAEPEQELSGRRRSDLRRAQRRATQLGKSSYEVLTPSPAELGPLLQEALDVEAAGWKGRARTALAHDPTRRAFFRRYATAASSKGILRLCFLRIDGRAAAVQLAVETGDRFWLLKVGYDERFARCSPGSLLLLETIRYAASRGLRSYEFLGDAESWTEPWTQEVRPCVHLDAYPFERWGVGVLATDAAAAAGRRLRHVVRSRQ
jgi:CelD/BcsL family acetyltransferase involved in cellulose biosynthesis